MPVKTVPWWRRALNFALDGIRSGFGLFSRQAKPEPTEGSHSLANNKELLVDSKQETLLPKQPVNPESLAAKSAAVPSTVPAAEAGKAAAPMPSAGSQATRDEIDRPVTASEAVVKAVEIAGPPVPSTTALEPATEPVAPIEPVEATPAAQTETPAEPQPAPGPPALAPPTAAEPEPIAQATPEPSPELAPVPVAIPLNQAPDEILATSEADPIHAPEQRAEPTEEAEPPIVPTEEPTPTDQAAGAPETGIATPSVPTHAFQALPDLQIEEPAEPAPTLPSDPMPPRETPVEAEPEPEIAATLEPLPEQVPEPEPTPEPELPEQAAPDEAALPVPFSIESAEMPESAPVADPDPESAPVAEAIPEPAPEAAPREDLAAAACADAKSIVELVAETVPTKTEEPEHVPAPSIDVVAQAASTSGPIAELAPEPTAPFEPSAPSPADEKAAARLAARQKRLGEADEQSPFSVIVDQVYDGPLDLLLDLIRKQDIDIYDIPIAKITAQFLAYVDQLKAGDVDVAGEFIYTASLLIHIKSKMLLPRAPAGPEDAPEDPRRELVERLLEHERFKNAAQMLQQKQLLEAATWTNPGAQEFKDDEGAEPEIAADTVDLVRIFRDILERARKRPVIDVTEDQVTVGQMIQFLARRLTMEDKPVALRRLLSHTRSERALIAMFLALLELVRLQAILLRQDRQFSEIFVKKHTGFDTVMNEGLINAQDDWK